MHMLQLAVSLSKKDIELKSLTSSKQQGGLLAKAREDDVLSEFIDNIMKTAEMDSALTTILVDAKRTAFAAKRRLG
jgi:hypothetical protein